MVTTEKGFTLSEALVAIVVLSLGLLGLERMHIAAIQVNTIASRLTQATTLAQDRAEQLMALPYNVTVQVVKTGGIRLRRDTS